MQCPRCQHENPAEAAFCDECGARLDPTCSLCGEAQLRAGRGPGARDTAMRAVTLARERGERGHEAEALHLLGATTASPPAVDAALAEAHYREALALARAREMRPVVAHCELGLGRLYRRTGDAAKAQEHLTTSATMYREMGMAFWLEQAEAESESAPRSSP